MWIAWLGTISLILTISNCLISWFRKRMSLYYLALMCLSLTRIMITWLIVYIESWRSLKLWDCICSLWLLLHSTIKDHGQHPRILLHWVNKGINSSQDKASMFQNGMIKVIKLKTSPHLTNHKNVHMVHRVVEEPRIQLLHLILSNKLLCKMSHLYLTISVLGKRTTSSR